MKKTYNNVNEFAQLYPHWAHEIGLYTQSNPIVVNHGSFLSCGNFIVKPAERPRIGQFYTPVDLQELADMPGSRVHGYLELSTIWDNWTDVLGGEIVLTHDHKDLHTGAEWEVFLPLHGRFTMINFPRINQYFIVPESTFELFVTEQLNAIEPR